MIWRYERKASKIPGDQYRGYPTDICNVDINEILISNKVLNHLLVIYIMKKWSHNKMMLPKMREYAKIVDETKYNCTYKYNYNLQL